MRLRVLTAAALAAWMLSAAPAPAADPCSAGDDVTNAFTCLFNIFPRSGGEGTIGYALARQAAKNGGTGPIKPGGPLVIVNEFGVFVYDGSEAKQGALVGQVLTRNDPNSGFVQMTALSHAGPAVAYLAALEEAATPETRTLLLELLDRVRKARAALRANPAWAKTVEAPAWKTYVTQIYLMMDYGLWMAGDYLVRVRDGKVKAFSQKSVGEDFYDGGLEDYPVPFNNVMIATFMLVALNSADQIRTLVEQTAEKVDWKNARVLVHMPIGTNYGAGLTVQTNQLAHALTVLTDDALQDVNVLIAPYADAPCPGASVTDGCPLEVFQKAVLDPALFEFYSTRAWFGIYNRTQIAENAFWNVKPLEPFKFPARPGDYGFTKADDINGFMRRLRNSLVDKRELLSNAVGYWMPGELKAKGWDPSKVDIPGLNTGFPNGVKGYPQESPAIPD